MTSLGTGQVQIQEHCNLCNLHSLYGFLRFSGYFNAIFDIITVLYITFSHVLVPIHNLLDLQLRLYFPCPFLSCERSEPRLSDTHPSERIEPRTCGSEATKNERERSSPRIGAKRRNASLHILYTYLVFCILTDFDVLQRISWYFAVTVFFEKYFVPTMIQFEFFLHCQCIYLQNM